MTKILATSLFALTAIFASSASASNNNDSINHLFEEQQLAQFCSQIGVSSNTRIKIKLPTGTIIYGTITCGEK